MSRRPPSPAAPRPGRRSRAATGAADAPPRAPARGAGRPLASLAVCGGAALLALAVRLPHLAWGAPRIEEEALPMKKAIEMWGFGRGAIQLDPHTAGWPSLSFYVHLLLQHVHWLAGRLAGTFADRNDYFVAEWTDPTPVLVLSRALGVAAACGVTWIGARLGVRLAGLVAGAVAGLALALAPLLVRHAQLVTPDILLTFCAAMALARLLDVHDRGRTSDYAAAGLWIGLGASCKYSPVLLLPALAVAHALGARGGRRDAPRTAGRLALGVAAAVGAFAVTSPFVVLHGATLVRDLAIQTFHLAGGHLGQASRLPGYVGYVTDVLGPGLGWGALVLGVLGLGLEARRSSGAWWVVVAAALPFYLVFGALRTQFDRYLLPMLLPLALGAGALTVRLAATAGRRGAGLRAAAVGACAAAVALPALAGTLSYHRDIARPSTAALADRWLAERAARGTFPVAAELLSFAAPSDAPPPEVVARLSPEQRRRVSTRPAYDITYLPFYTTTPEAANAYYDLRLYLPFEAIVTSDAVGTRYLAEPARFAREVAFYRDLERYADRIAVFGGDSTRGPEIRVYRLTRGAELLRDRGALPPDFAAQAGAPVEAGYFAQFMESAAHAAAGRRMWSVAAFDFGVLAAGDAARALPAGQRLGLLHTLAYAQRLAGDLTGAENTCRAALAAAPGDARTWGDYGGVLAAAGRTAESQAALRRCLALAVLTGDTTAAAWARARLPWGTSRAPGKRAALPP